MTPKGQRTGAHTKGPWRVEIHGGVGANVYDDAGDLVCQTYREYASLIASAPTLRDDNHRLRGINAELLAALKGIGQWLQGEDNIGDDGGPRTDLLILRSDVAKLIKKAEGDR